MPVTHSRSTHVWFTESDGSAIQWCLCRVRFQDFEVLGLMQLWVENHSLRLLILYRETGKLLTRADLSFELVMK
jgi:hypothetical protein